MNSARAEPSVMRRLHPWAWGIGAMILFAGNGSMASTPPTQNVVPAVAGEWREAPPHRGVRKCSLDTLTLTAAGDEANIGQVVRATVKHAPCGLTDPDLTLQETEIQDWRGVVIAQDGRVQVSLRRYSPDGAGMAVSDSLTLWMTFDGCELAGVQKLSGSPQMLVLRRPACQAAKSKPDTSKPDK